MPNNIYSQKTLRITKPYLFGFQLSVYLLNMGKNQTDNNTIKQNTLKEFSRHSLNYISQSEVVTKGHYSGID